MQANDVLYTLRHALEWGEADVVRFFELSGHAVEAEVVAGMLVTPAAESWVECSDAQLGQVLDGLIVAKRGPRDGSLPQREPARIDNNEVLKKLRIAWNLREPGLMEALASGGMRLSKTEVSGLFRKRGNKHFRQCSDAVLKCMIQGVALLDAS